MRQSGRAAGISTIRSEVAPSPLGRWQGDSFAEGTGTGWASPGPLWAAPAGPGPGGAQLGTGKNAAFLLGLFC